MNLIVFDLEWNIGYKPKTFLYHGTELTLRGEIIQIGAARINEHGDVLDTFEVNLRPRIFRKLQHHIAKVTGMSQGDLDAGMPMRDGLQKFLDWAGPDAELAEWGLDDVPVLKQNLFLAGLDERWPAQWYDLQRIFLQTYPRREGEGLTLESVVDPVSLYEPVYSDEGDTIYVMDQLGDDGGEDSWISGIMFRDTVQALSEREKKIMALRYLSGKTQVEVAKEIGISQAQVSRLEKNALGRIKGKL